MKEETIVPLSELAAVLNVDPDNLFKGSLKIQNKEQGHDELPQPKKEGIKTKGESGIVANPDKPHTV